MAGKRALAFSAVVIGAVLQLFPTWDLCLITWTQRPASPWYEVSAWRVEAALDEIDVFNAGRTTDV